MKKVLFACCLFFFTVKAFGQQFLQYNTGTLYDTFENPSQRMFIPDTTKNFAFNFLIPNLNYNLYITGDAQNALLTRETSSYYNNANLEVGKGRYNYFNANVKAYTIMFKMYASPSGNVELGFFTDTKLELRGAATDESVALLNGSANFPNSIYNNVFNDNYSLQAYHQIGFTYREQVTNKFAFGIKLSALSGIEYKKVQINQSSINFDKANDQATLALQGTAYSNGTPDGTPDIQKITPTFLNPGAAITIGTSYVDENGYKWQGNIKDLGFIHWNNTSYVANFSSNAVITGLTTGARETNVIDQAGNITSANKLKGGFNTATNGLMELSVNKSYWMDYDEQFKFSPTLIASKEMFYSGFTAALVAPVQYQKFTVSSLSSYNDLKLFNLGGQFMVKSLKSEFFVGSERLYQSGVLFKSVVKGNTDPNQVQPQYPTSQGSFVGMDFYIGASFTFGSIIESRMNESSVPNGDKGFIGRLFDKLFNKDKNY
jgi:hypothetical protein